MPTPSTTPRRWAVGFCIAVLSIVIGASVLGPREHLAGPSTSGPTWFAALRPGDARATLERLARVEPTPEVAYDRIRDFGRAWTDVDHNGCDTRNDILRRDLGSVVVRDDGTDCVVLSGSMVDPYTGAWIDFTRSDPTAVQIDHVVPLHAAWILGAWRWPFRRRLAFANDRRNLVAVDGPTNQAKGDRLADRWLPPDHAIRCTYAIDTVEVHAAYELGVTAEEYEALSDALRTCP